MKKISLKEFLYHFSDQARGDKNFCFVLGSGASRPSGIPTGGELVQTWIKDIEEKLDGADFNTWLNREGILRSDLAKDYCKIYDKRFCLDKEDGFAYLERKMEKVEPSVGYSVLAQILAQGQHRVVITTNFDSLTEDALFVYTNKKPLVVGHESLAHYIKPFGQRPVVIKVHRDLLLSPINDASGTSHLADGFSKNLETIFKYYTPLIIGYGGNDGSLMGFLERLDEIKGGLFWFYREVDGVLSERIQKLVKKFRGNFVKVSGFDELMIQLGDKLELEKLDEKIIEVAKARSEAYRNQIEKITQASRSDEDTKDALEGIVKRGKKTWWSYELDASSAESIEEKDRIYYEGLKEFPSSAELKGNYAIFLSDVRKDYDRAEQLYKEAIELDPQDADFKGNYANFLYEVRREHDRAEELYKKAIELDPQDGDFKGNYANFLTSVRRDYDRAEQLYKEAIELDPQNGDFKSVYAGFLKNVRKNHALAEVLYMEAKALNIKKTSTEDNHL
jgi:tetratricopeptide (TPR) repeat protein